MIFNYPVTRIVSIDTGNPDLPDSTTALVRLEFSAGAVKRNAVVYGGTYKNQKERILKICQDADYVVIEKIEATNKYLARSVMTEQVELATFLKNAHMPVHELIRSGRKEVITDDLMKLVELWNEGPHKTHHHDVREATRNALYFMAKDESLNLILSDYVQHFFK